MDFDLKIRLNKKSLIFYRLLYDQKIYKKKNIASLKKHKREKTK